MSEDDPEFAQALLAAGNNPTYEAIRRAISDMDKIEGLSGYEKSDYLATLAKISEATGHDSEAVEIESRADQLLGEAL